MSKIQTPTSYREAAIKIIEKSYPQLSHVYEDEEITSEIEWRPSCHWKTRTGYIACEVSDVRPRMPIVDLAYGQISSLGIPIRMIVAYPQLSNLSAREVKLIQDDQKYLQEKGIGLIKIDDYYNAEIIKHGISVPLFIPHNHIKDSNFKKPLCINIEAAYEAYNSIIPKSGVAELGQLIESILINLAIQAHKNGTLTGFTPGKFIPQANLIDLLSSSRVISSTLLARCRAFCEDRNGVSHKPQSIKEAQRIEKLLRENFMTGLRILEEISIELKDKGYKLKYSI